jgi:hypothetical protein
MSRVRFPIKDLHTRDWRWHKSYMGVMRVQRTERKMRGRNIRLVPQS